MKKTLLLGGLLAIALTAGAENAKLNVISGGEKVRAFKADGITAITYSSPLGGEGMSHIKFDFTDGDHQLMRLDEIDDMRYEEGLRDNPFSVEVTPHHMCATLNIIGGNNEYYRLAGTPISRLSNYDRTLWAEMLIDKDIEYIQSVADYYQRPLSSWNERDIFNYETGKLDWFPDEIIDPGTPLAICLYTCKLKGDDVEVTSEPILFICQCKEVEDVGTKFKIEADVTSTKITVKVDPIDDDEIYYNIGLYSADQIAEYGLPYLVSQSLYSLEEAIYKYGAYPSWDAALFQGHGERTWTNKRSGDIWVAVAYGVEYGVTTTAASLEVYEIPLAEPTDPCTFTVDVTQKSPSEMLVKVTPSNPDTRYVAYLVDDARIKGDPEEHKAEYYVSGQVYAANYMNTVNWATSPLVYTGENTLSTYNGVFDGKYIPVDTDYHVLIFGIDEVGTRTTALMDVPIRTTAIEMDELKFEVTFSDFNAEGDYFHSIRLKVTPSDPDAKYVVDKLSTDNAYGRFDCTPEEFANRYVQAQGKYLPVRTGDYEQEIFMNSSYSSETGWSDYSIFIFGYDGMLTSPLYLYKVDPVTGEVTMLSGPEAVE